MSNRLGGARSYLGRLLDMRALCAVLIWMEILKMPDHAVIDFDPLRF